MYSSALGYLHSWLRLCASLCFYRWRVCVFECAFQSVSDCTSLTGPGKLELIS